MQTQPDRAALRDPQGQALRRVSCEGIDRADTHETVRCCGGAVDGIGVVESVRTKGLNQHGPADFRLVQLGADLLGWHAAKPSRFRARLEGVADSVGGNGMDVAVDDHGAGARSISEMS